MLYKVSDHLASEVLKWSPESLGEAQNQNCFEVWFVKPVVVLG